jgi:hypothetical protein
MYRCYFNEALKENKTFVDNLKAFFQLTSIVKSFLDDLDLDIRNRK